MLDPIGPLLFEGRQGAAVPFQVVRNILPDFGWDGEAAPPLLAALGCGSDGHQTAYVVERLPIEQTLKQEVKVMPSTSSPQPF